MEEPIAACETVSPVTPAAEGRPAMSWEKALVSRREYEMAKHVAQAMQDKEIAHATGLSCQTIKVYLSHLYAKLQLRRFGSPRVALALYFASGQISTAEGRQLLPRWSKAVPLVYPSEFEVPPRRAALIRLSKSLGLVK